MLERQRPFNKPKCIVRIRDAVQKTCLRRWTIGKSGERGSGISVLPARHDDDESQWILNMAKMDPQHNMLQQSIKIVIERMYVKKKKKKKKKIMDILHTHSDSFYVFSLLLHEIFFITLKLLITSSTLVFIYLHYHCKISLTNDIMWQRVFECCSFLMH